MSRLKNPYKDKTEPDTTQQIAGAVGVDDWNYVRERYPMRGVQDKILSALFRKFAEEVKQRKLDIYVPGDNNEEQLASIIAGITFERSNGDGLQHDE